MMTQVLHMIHYTPTVCTNPLPALDCVISDIMNTSEFLMIS